MKHQQAVKKQVRLGKNAFTKERAQPEDSALNISIPLPSSKSLFEESCIEDLDEEHLVQQLEQWVSKLQDEKEQVQLSIAEKLKDAKTRSLMTKYQMLFVKIEIYVTTFVQIIAERQKRHKLAAMMAIKQRAKDNVHKARIASELFLQKSVKFFSLVERILVQKKRISQIFAIMNFKFSLKVMQLKQDIEKSTHNVYSNAKLDKIGEESNSALFSKTQNSNFRKNSSISVLNFETQIDEERSRNVHEAVTRNRYLKMRLQQTEEIGLGFIEELDTMMSLFIKKNEKHIIRKVK